MKPIVSGDFAVASQGRIKETDASKQGFLTTKSTKKHEIFLKVVALTHEPLLAKSLQRKNGVVHKSMFSGNSCGDNGLAVLPGRVELQGQETTFHEKRAYPFGVRELAPAFKASASRRITI